MPYTPPRFDLTEADPLFGVPVLGNYLNMDQLIAGYLADLLTPQDSPASKIAREEGAIHSWQQRSDISDPVKIGVELATGMVPDLLLGAITGGLGIGAIVPKWGGKVAKVSGLVGELGPTKRALASASITEPAADWTFRQLDAALKHIPGIKQLLEPSAKGAAATEVAQIAGALQSAKRGYGFANAASTASPTVADVVKPAASFVQSQADALVTDIGTVKTGKLDLPKFARKYGVSLEDASALIKTLDDSIAAGATPLVGATRNTMGDALNAGLSTERAATAKAMGVGVKAATQTPAVYDVARLATDIAAATTPAGVSKLASTLGLATEDAAKVAELSTLIDVAAIAEKAKTSEEFFDGLLKGAHKALAGPSTPPNKFVKAYQGVLSLMKQGMLAGFTFIPNAVDIAGKTVTSQGLSGLPKLVSALKVTAKNAEKAVPGIAKFEGIDAISPRLGVIDFAENLTGAKKGILGTASNKALAAVGAATGALTGNPIGVAVNAAQLVGMKYLYNFNTGKAMPALESMARQVHFLDGVTQYFTKKSLGFFKPAVRDTLLKEVDDIAEAAGKKAELTEFVTKNQFLVTPEDVGQEARRLGIAEPSSNRIEEVWREVHAEARDAGIAFSNSINFDYMNDTKLTEFLRSWVPFPVWPMHNIPYYAKKSMTYPIIPAIIGSTAEKARETQDYYGLPSRFNDRLPVADIGTGTVFADPMAPLSIAGQFTEPPTRFSDNPATLLDSISDAAGYVGMGPNPIISSLLQTLGLTNRGRDMGDITPMTRLTRPLTQAITGQNYEPENILKAPLEGLRQTLAPDAVPDSTYQEYLVRKKLAEMAIAKTGKTWENAPDYARAMQEGPSNLLFQDAQRQVGVEQAAVFTARRALPASIAYLPKEELAIRNAKERFPLPANPTSADYKTRDALSPLASGYDSISGSQQKVELQAKINVFFSLGTSAAKTAYAKANPDLKSYLDFSTAAKESKTDGSVDAYLAMIKQ